MATASAWTSGTLHAIASVVAMLLSASLWRTNPAWTRHRWAIMGPAHATWIGLVLMAAYLMWAVPRAGGFNPEVWAGPDEPARGGNLSGLATGHRLSAHRERQGTIAPPWP